MSNQSWKGRSVGKSSLVHFCGCAHPISKTQVLQFFGRNILNAVCIVPNPWEDEEKWDEEFGRLLMDPSRSITPTPPTAPTLTPTTLSSSSSMRRPNGERGHSWLNLRLDSVQFDNSSSLVSSIKGFQRLRAKGSGSVWYEHESALLTGWTPPSTEYVATH